MAAATSACAGDGRHLFRFFGLRCLLERGSEVMPRLCRALGAALDVVAEKTCFHEHCCTCKRSKARRVP